MAERLSELEKWRIAELAAQGWPTRLIGKEIGRAHRRGREQSAGDAATGCAGAGAVAVAVVARLSARRSRGVWRAVSRCGRSRGGWAGRRRRSRVRSPRTVDGGAIGRAERTRPRCGGCVARSGRSSVACRRLRAVVEAKLELRWSPQQISGWLVEEFPDDPEMRVSHETIYLSLFVQSRGALRKELTRYLRSGHTTRRPRGHTVDERSRASCAAWSTSANDPPKPKTAPCPAIGKATSSWASGCTRSRRWSNARPASSC